MSEEEYQQILFRIGEHQNRLRVHADANDEFSSVEKRLVVLLERTKERLVHKHGGQ